MAPEPNPMPSQSGSKRQRVFRGVAIVEVFAFADPNTPDDKLPFDVAARLADELPDMNGGNEHVFMQARYPTVVQEFTELREVGDAS